MYHYKSCGLPNIYLKNGYTVTQTAYGDGVSIENIEGLHNTIAMAIIKGEKSLSGAEFRFLRKLLDMSQKALADCLGVTEQTVANYEKTEPQPTADRLLRTLVQETIEGSSHIRELIDHLNHLDRREQEQRVFEQGDDWHLAECA